MDNTTTTALLDTPWRNLGEDPWSNKSCEKLRNEILTHKHNKKAKLKHIKVLLVGEVQAGKSSFFNTVNSVFANRVKFTANAGYGAMGGAEGSLTTQYRTYKVRAKDDKNQEITFVFCDSMGLEGKGKGLEDKGLKAVDVSKIMDGHVKDMAELSHGGMRPGDIGYNQRPKMPDKIQCVVFVIAAHMMSFMNEVVVDKIKEIRKEANQRCLNPIIVLTNIDQICPDTKKDVRKVYHSEKIQKWVQDASRKFGITENMIYPIRNYSFETETENGINILTLRTLRQILRCSEDFLEDYVDREDEKLRQAEKTKKDIKKRRSSGRGKSNSTTDSSDSDGDASKEDDSLQEDTKDEDSDTNSDRAEKTKLMKKGKKGNSVKSIPPPLPPVPTSKRAKSGIAIYDFKAKSSEHVRIKKSQHVKEIKPDVGGWTKVQVVENEKKGLVPTNYIEWEAPPIPNRPRKAKTNQDLSPNSEDEGSDVKSDSSYASSDKAEKKKLTKKDKKAPPPAAPLPPTPPPQHKSSSNYSSHLPRMEVSQKQLKKGRKNLKKVPIEEGLSRAIGERREAQNPDIKLDSSSSSSSELW